MAQFAAKLVTAAGTEDQSIIATALTVRHLAAAFAKGLATLQANLGPGAGRQRRRGQQQALHWQLITAQRWQRHPIALHRRYHPMGPDLPMGGADQTGLL